MSRPTTDLADTVRFGSEFYSLCDEYRTLLEPRCEPGAIDGLKADLARLGAKQEAAVNIRVDKKALRLGQEQQLATGAGLISLMRNIVRTRYPADKELQKKFGVGEALNHSAVDSVAAGLRKVAEALELNAASARAAGILPEDVVLVTATYEALTSKNQNQEEKKVSSKQATALRNETHLRVERTIATLYAIAQFVFRDEPQILARFTGALPPTRTARARARKKAAAATSSSTPSTPTTPA
jgi:hypothetical protein